MYLKSLTLRGFKSFASATTLKFEPGICAVVGPNGSGKSNVVDALAWVMGEQGAKNLRGGKMEDVIFAGAGERKPLGRAEVTLTIDNSDGALPIEYREVSVTRRMFRDGASEYEINGSRARLMDIQELLSDSGIGREMHVIVGQGRLAQILESRPEDRRAFIEEAAGVLKHRRRKEKAQRKLVGMQANLDRLNDLTTELRRQLKPLARQAEAAQRAATVQADVRDSRLRLAGHRVVELQEELNSAESQARVLVEKVELVTEQLEEAIAQQTEIDDLLAEATPRAESAQHLWFELSALAERVAATQRIASDRASSIQEVAYSGPDPDILENKAVRADNEYQELAEAAEIARERLEAIQEEAEQREEASREAEQEHLAQVRAIADKREGVVRLLASEESQRKQVESAQAEVSRLAETTQASSQRQRELINEKNAIDESVAQLHAEMAPLSELHTQATTEAETSEKRLEQLRVQRGSIDKLVSRLESRIETLTATMQVVTLEKAPSGLEECTPLGSKVRPRPGTEKAVSAALGRFTEALAAVAFDTGSVNDLDIDSVARTIVVTSAGSDGWRMDADLPSDASWLLDHVDIDSDVRGAITRVLADAVWVPNLEAGRALIEQDPRLRAVTSEGTMLGQGWIELGSGGYSSVEAASHIETAQAELDIAHAQLEELSGTLEGAHHTAAEARVAAARATAALRDHQHRISEAERDSSRLQQQCDAHQKQHQQALEQCTKAEARMNQLQEEWEEIKNRLDRVSDNDIPEEPSSVARDEAASALAQIKAMEMEARLNLRTAEERAENAQGKGEGLRRQAHYERQAKIRHEQAMERRIKQSRLAATVAEGADTLAQRVSMALEKAATEKNSAIAERTRLAAQAANAKDTVNALQNQLNRLSDTAHASEIAQSQSQVRLEEAQEKLVEQLGVPIQDLLRDYAPGADFDVAAERARLKQAEKDLSALGKVNPLALEEFKALEERYEFLSTQLADVEQARQDLGGVIEDVDAKILQLFTDAWRDVEAEFPKVFATLFPGGEGRLILTEPDDMLATGIEVEARPPGKKVKRLSLLSGGEKSLTALAMLVAIFRARPSPFYVMDEVEAALDDVNLRRLIALFEELRKDSQLIVITHQKPTMDVANVLYGVTMRGDGVTRVISQRMSPGVITVEHDDS
ncbi:chromosome segregation protein SMC [Corynebacterium ulcerans]|uniref:Chromosome partition protein Smc n=1 Tax=Corynebacterium ulcerans TaxID=65058 RepID=A0ABD7MR53_CORUL|nr:chromosome segregation protein SMC [Corynebacterium ulcerans]MBH5296039.1 chromosome segregation protein SMC [Corynebacterium ulcerans]MBH5298097.1 chromosome segregation protein SMC [Corynebacterium ulcerans]MDK8887883.1 chromosome segregation protein SMC [Corynebacterium ulcerans]QQU25264.1 chromosome segregation protein SMC [Corynebacterium ulcerans]SNV05076.1 chromosome partition protein [Corynebacterium ulcerans]